MALTYPMIKSAEAQISAAGLRSPAIEAVKLSDLCGADIVLKLENLQPTGSFKIRGALVKMESLDAGSRSSIGSE